ncbi:eIF-2-alpha kinase GCN2 [Hondaea fermentalgiana]|uniref:non-specific serine/threonine protein kinase n=1 Tax=Hondaea fermentalgiana TaxID=2315210 RepID=A0A2R5GQV7_9STRA|nr:eIF-2-alpha kinase GCN2 [Hondaea fermentalgiana]|eukprot:GBG33262.1 eIF-2-alpha kinase GCN2 [Hondaea fermentalgiana]
MPKRRGKPSRNGGITGQGHGPASPVAVKSASARNLVNSNGTLKTDDPDGPREVNEAAEEEMLVLESIFGGEIVRDGHVWGQPKIKILVQPHLSQRGGPQAHENVLKAELEVVYTKAYPRTPPTIKVLQAQGIKQESAKLLEKAIRQEGLAKAGPDAEPFLYDIVQTTQAFLLEHRVRTTSFYEEFQAKEARVAAQQRVLEAQRVEQERRKAANLHARVDRALDAPAIPSPLLAAVQSDPLTARPSSQRQEDLDAEPMLPLALPPGAGPSTNSRYLKDFDELQVLGVGGFGKVVKARNRLDGRVYAIKKIKFEGSENDMKLLREVTSLAKMSHQYIVRYYQAWVEETEDDDSDSDGDDYDDGFGTDSVTTGQRSSRGPISHLLTSSTTPNSKKPFPPSSSSDTSSHAGGFLFSPASVSKSGSSAEASDESDVESEASSSSSSSSSASSAAESESGSEASPSSDSDAASDSASSNDFPSVGYDFGDWSDEEGLGADETLDQAASGLSSSGFRYAGASNSLARLSARGEEADLHEASSGKHGPNDEEQPRIRQTLYIQMEYCSGQTLRQVIDEGRLAGQQITVWKLFRQLCEALVYVHETCHFIHRDLKPDNVFLDEHGNVKLGDFGLAITSTPASAHAAAVAVAARVAAAAADAATAADATTDADARNTPTGKGKASKATKEANDKNRTKKKGKTKKKAAAKTTTQDQAIQKKSASATSRKEFGSAIPDLTEDGKTGGVGTALYRAQEVLSGRYSEKCDMWSLGIILFEMLLPPFPTSLERIRTLMELREHGRVESVSLPRKTLHLIQDLLAHDPDKRPSAQTVIGRIPHKLETEERYFDEVLRVVRSSDASPLYSRLMDALFTQRTRDEVFFTYDAALLQDQSAVDHLAHGRELAAQMAAFGEMQQAFARFGAIPFSAPLLTPKRAAPLSAAAATVTGNLSQEPQDPSTTQLMDAQGTIVELPRNLTRPFARYLALRGNVLYMKRYEGSRVYSTAERNNNRLGGQPRSKFQAALDVVAPLADLETIDGFASAWRSDFFHGMLDALGQGAKLPDGWPPAPGLAVVYIQDYKLQRRALRRVCGIDLDDPKVDAAHVLSTLDAVHSATSWPAARKRLVASRLFSQKQLATLRPFIVAEAPKKTPKKQKKGHNKASPDDEDSVASEDADKSANEAAEKQRELLKLFGDESETRHLQELLQEPSFCCKFRPWLAPIPGMTSGLFFAILLRAPQPQGASVNKRRARINTTDDSDGARHAKAPLRHQSSSICAQYGGGEFYVAATGGRYDDLRGIPLVINKRRASYRVRGARSFQDKEFIHWEQVVNYVESVLAGDT